MGLHVRESGPAWAPTILFLHGGGQSGQSWQPVVERLHQYRCLTPDLPDHGQSVDEGPFDMARAAAAVADIIRPRVDGGRVLLVGHSLGGLTALLASGLGPVPGLESRCRQALSRLPINNPSRLLQCQLASTGLPPTPSPPADLRGVVVLNGFGSLLWPSQGLAPLRVPVLMAGGSLDLVTPPVEEQLGLFLPPGDPRSVLVLVEGGSHFSPVRVADSEEALFRLGSGLVGVEPRTVQRLLLRITSEFLQSLDQPMRLPSQRLVQEGVTAYVLDPQTARRWRALLRP